MYTRNAPTSARHYGGCPRIEHGLLEQNPEARKERAKLSTEEKTFAAYLLHSLDEGVEEDPLS